MVGWGKGQFECSGQTEGLVEWATRVLPANWSAGGRGSLSAPSILMSWGTGQLECSQQIEKLGEGAVWVFPANWGVGRRGTGVLPVWVLPANWRVGRRGSLSAPSKLRSWEKGQSECSQQTEELGEGELECSQQIEELGEGELECSQQIEELGEGELEWSQQTEVSNYLTFKCVCFQHTAASNHSAFSYFSHWAVITCGWLKPCKSDSGGCVFMCGVMGRPIYISFVNTSKSANKGDN